MGYDFGIRFPFAYARALTIAAPNEKSDAPFARRSTTFIAGISLAAVSNMLWNRP
jgi:hypothetical protein